MFVITHNRRHGTTITGETNKLYYRKLLLNYKPRACWGVIHVCMYELGTIIDSLIPGSSIQLTHSGAIISTDLPADAQLIHVHSLHHTLYIHQGKAHNSLPLRTQYYVVEFYNFGCLVYKYKLVYYDVYKNSRKIHKQYIRLLQRIQGVVRVQ